MCINKINLSTATRRFITRNVFYQREDADVEMDSSLFKSLMKYEYWSFDIKTISESSAFVNKKMTFDKAFKEECLSLENLLGLIVAHAVDLYNKLENDDISKAKTVIKQRRKKTHMWVIDLL